MKVAAFILSALWLVPFLGGETLGDVLAAHRIPAYVLPEKEVRQSITSFAVSADNLPFLLAYYDDDGSEILPPILHVIRYDGRTGELLRKDLQGVDEPFRGFDGVMVHISSNCMGSALAISESNGFITIDTHVSPSAGCILILKPDLSFSAGLSGWVLAKIDGSLILQESMIHFAGTHPSHIYVYNPLLRKLSLIYPPKRDPKREEFSKELRKYLPVSKWCMEDNSPCDSESFSADVGPVLVNEREHSFVFDVQMTPEGFGDDAARWVNPTTVHYVCTWKSGRWILASQ
jgi:hypothetical protein